MAVNDARQHAWEVYEAFKKTATDVTDEQEWLKYLKTDYDEDQATWKPKLRMSDEEKIMSLGRDIWKETNIRRSRRTSQMELPLDLHGHILEEFYTVPKDSSSNRTGRVFREHLTLRHWGASIKMRRANLDRETKNLDAEEAAYDKAVEEAGGQLNTLAVKLAKQVLPEAAE